MNITKEEISSVIIDALKDLQNFPYIIHLSRRHPYCVCQISHNAIILDKYDATSDLFDCCHGNTHYTLSFKHEIVNLGERTKESSNTVKRLLYTSLKKRGMTVQKARKGLNLSPYLKNKIIPFRVSIKEYYILKTRAKRENTSIGRYIRKKIF